MVRRPVMADRLKIGDEVVISWGLGDVHGTVAEVYGPTHNRHVVVRLTPELSGYVVAEPTTVALPYSEVKLAGAAA
jgi:rRNA processing protein Gar1